MELLPLPTHTLTGSPMRANPNEQMKFASVPKLNRSSKTSGILYSTVPLSGASSAGHLIAAQTNYRKRVTKSLS